MRFWGSFFGRRVSKSVSQIKYTNKTTRITMPNKIVHSCIQSSNLFTSISFLFTTLDRTSLVRS